MACHRRKGSRRSLSYPAQILGVADQLGTIEVGKRANLVLTTGEMLQVSSQVQAVFIDGKPLEPTSKQTRLYDRYRERLKEFKDGRRAARNQMSRLTATRSRRSGAPTGVSRSAPQSLRVAAKRCHAMICFLRSR